MIRQEDGWGPSVMGNELIKGARNSAACRSSRPISAPTISMTTGGLTKVGLVMLLALGVMGCQQQRLITGSTLHDGYRTTHPITIDQMPKVLDIPVGSRATHLSRELAGVVRQFADEAKDAGAPEIIVMVPIGTRNEAAAQSVAYSAQAAMASSGYGSHNVQIRPYAVDMPNAIAPVRLIYETVGAKTANPCGRWQDEIGADSDPNGYSEYGCSTQSNLAAMVSNPSDLLYPRTVTPADAARQVRVFENYQNGENTATDYETNAAVTN